MNNEALALENVYDIFLTGIIIILAVMLLFCFFRACLGPKVADRIVAVNMMGTIVMVMIAVLAVRMKESYLVDICIIYAMISFLAVIVLTKVYMGVYLEKKQKEKEEEGNGNI